MKAHHQKRIDTYKKLTEEVKDENQPFNYAEWKASSVKPRKPRGHKDAAALYNAQMKSNKEKGIPNPFEPKKD